MRESVEELQKLGLKRFRITLADCIREGDEGVVYKFTAKSKAQAWRMLENLHDGCGLYPNREDWNLEEIS